MHWITFSMIYLAAAPVCSGSCARFAVSRRPSQRCRVSAAAHHGCDGSEDAATAGAPGEALAGRCSASAAAADTTAPTPISAWPSSTLTAGAVALPGGALWWQNLHTSGMQPVYGESFVMQRRAVGGQGLVRRVPQPPPVRHTLPPASPPAVWHAPSAGTGLALAGVGLGSGTVVIDTEFVVLGPSRAAQRPAANTTCVGMVWQPSPQAAAEVQAAPSLRRRRSKHPRRTQMVSVWSGSSLAMGGMKRASASTLEVLLQHHPAHRHALSPMPYPVAASLHLQLVQRDQRLRSQPPCLVKGFRVCTLQRLHCRCAWLG